MPVAGRGEAVAGEMLQPGLRHGPRRSRLRQQKRVPGDPRGPDSIVEIVLRGGRLLRVSSDLDGATLARLIRVTEAA